MKMKMTKYCRIALIAIIGAVLAHGAARAENQDDDISVYGWGPWGKMIPPAAVPVLAFPAALFTGFDYQPELDPADEPTGSLPRSYATYARETFLNGNEERNPPVAATMELALDLEFYENDEEHGDVFASFRVEARENNPVYPPVVSLGMEGGYDRGPDGGKGFEAYYEEGFISPDGTEHDRRSGIYGYTAPPWVGDITIGYWGDEGEFTSEESHGGGGHWAWGKFLVGTTPPVGVMEALNAGNIQASYSGFTHRGFISGNYDEVTFNFNFGAGTGTGTFEKAFTTTGNIVGPDFISTGVRPIDQWTSANGNVTGSFFGNEAQVFGGLADVMLSNDNMTENYTEVFVTIDDTVDFDFEVGLK